jgi:membrane protein YqaA with SNARE-associated domain
VVSLIYLVALVFVFNFAPAFAPPTWSVLVLFSLNTDLPPALIVIAGAISAGTGRYSLARATGLLRIRIKGKSLKNLESAQKVFEEKSSRKILLLLFFIISPLPSAQLFEAAGLIGAKLLPLTLAFFSGRLVTYSFYVAGASELKAHGIGELITKELTSVWAIAFQILMITGVVMLTRINWSRFLTKRKLQS